MATGDLISRVARAGPSSLQDSAVLFYPEPLLLPLPVKEVALRAELIGLNGWPNNCLLLPFDLKICRLFMWQASLH